MYKYISLDTSKYHYIGNLRLYMKNDVLFFEIKN